MSVPSSSGGGQPGAPHEAHPFVDPLVKVAKLRKDMSRDEVRAQNEKLNGTHGAGEVEATYAELVETFGPPFDGPDDDIDGKMTSFFIVEFNDGTVATIYDWKTGADYTIRERMVWNVGGHSKRSLAAVTGALERRRAAAVGAGSASYILHCTERSSRQAGSRTNRRRMLQQAAAAAAASRQQENLLESPVSSSCCSRHPSSSVGPKMPPFSFTVASV